MLEERNYVRVDKVWRDLRARVVSLTPEGVAALSSLLSRLRRL